MISLAFAVATDTATIKLLQFCLFFIHRAAAIIVAPVAISSFTNITIFPFSLSL